MAHAGPVSENKAEANFLSSNQLFAAVGALSLLGSIAVLAIALPGIPQVQFKPTNEEWLAGPFRSDQMLAGIAALICSIWLILASRSTKFRHALVALLAVIGSFAAAINAELNIDEAIAGDKAKFEARKSAELKEREFLPEKFAFTTYTFGGLPVGSYGSPLSANVANSPENSSVTSSLRIPGRDAVQTTQLPLSSSSEMCNGIGFSPKKDRDCKVVGTTPAGVEVTRANFTNAVTYQIKMPDSYVQLRSTDGSLTDQEAVQILGSLIAQKKTIA